MDTTAQIEKPLAGRPLPEFLRLPKSGSSCPVSGLSRSTINGLILGTNAQVKSVVLRQKGKTRGIRLIYTESLLAFLGG